MKDSIKEEWMISKKNYPLNHPVKIVRTNSEYDEKTGKILGKSYTDSSDFYIVGLDVPTKEALAISITEHCLISA